MSSIVAYIKDGDTKCDECYRKSKNMSEEEVLFEIVLDFKTERPIFICNKCLHDVVNHATSAWYKSQTKKYTIEVDTDGTRDTKN